MVLFSGRLCCPKLSVAYAGSCDLWSGLQARIRLHLNCMGGFGSQYILVAGRQATCSMPSWRSTATSCTNTVAMYFGLQNFQFYPAGIHPHLQTEQRARLWRVARHYLSFDTGGDEVERTAFDSVRSRVRCVSSSGKL
jgi:hypothetical protein